jgi:hypothetical protein
MQQSLKPTAGAARAGVIATEFLEKFLVRVHDSVTALDPGFGREALPAFTRYLETRTGRDVLVWISWHTSIE